MGVSVSFDRIDNMKQDSKSQSNSFLLQILSII